MHTEGKEFKSLVFRNAKASDAGFQILGEAGAEMRLVAFRPQDVDVEESMVGATRFELVTT